MTQSHLKAKVHMTDSHLYFFYLALTYLGRFLYPLSIHILDMGLDMRKPVFGGL